MPEPCDIAPVVLEKAGGWRASKNMRTDLVLDALKQAI